MILRFVGERWGFLIYLQDAMLYLASLIAARSETPSVPSGPPSMYLVRSLTPAFWARLQRYAKNANSLCIYSIAKRLFLHAKPRYFCRQARRDTHRPRAGVTTAGTTLGKKRQQHEQCRNKIDLCVCVTLFYSVSTSSRLAVRLIGLLH